LEETLVLVKGDGVRRRLIGEIIRRIENKGLDIQALQLMDVSRELAEKHYAEHRDKPFFEELVEFITSTPVVAIRTIRGDLALSMPDNLVHGSDSPESADRELELFFGA
jgi:nucleoside-diphosphate kinase